MNNYQADASRSKSKELVHNLKLSDAAKMLSGNVMSIPVPKPTHRYSAISCRNEKYYLTISTLDRRESRSDLFAVIITTYITHESRYIADYQRYAQEIHQRYNQ